MSQQKYIAMDFRQATNTALALSGKLLNTIGFAGCTGKDRGTDITRAHATLLHQGGLRLPHQQSSA